MKKHLGTIVIVAALAAVSGFPASAESEVTRNDKDFLIRWNLFEGTKAKDAERSEVVLSAGPKIPTVRQLSDAAKEPVRDLSGIRRELASIYQLENVNTLISDEWAWSRKNEKALNALLLQGEVMPITFTPRRVSGDRVNLRVQISRVPNLNAATPKATANIVDMEFLAKYNESMVLGFESGDRSYFLAFEVVRADAPESESGAGKIINEIEFLPAARPLVQTPPAYPPACKDAGIGGTVVLRIDAGADGTIANAEILKSVHPDLDRAAREAVLGWKYEPVLKDGKPVPVSFSLSISFNPDRKSDRKEAIETEAPLLRPVTAPPLPIPAAPAKSPDPKLAGILDKAAAYCDKLRGASLDFVCREQVKEWATERKTLGSASVKRNDLVYDYQLVKDKDAITERRTLL